VTGLAVVDDWRGQTGGPAFGIVFVPQTAGARVRLDQFIAMIPFEQAGQSVGRISGARPTNDTDRVTGSKWRRQIMAHTMPVNLVNV
jgi:hypothetical protein